jgi:sec-independent protein translocase protein TatA
MLGNIGFSELLVILVIIIIIFGVGKLPEVGRGLGKGIREFRDASKTEDEKLKDPEKAKLAEANKTDKPAN